MINSKYQITVIGAGSFGSRHLQGLTKINRDLSITVIDPNPNALDLAKQRYKEMPHNSHVRSIDYLESINNIDFDIDVAIIATTADIRRNVIENLLSRLIVKFLILEKVAFQSVQDFSDVFQLIKSRNSKAWVNCPRRMVPLFQDIRDRATQYENITMHVTGSNWGLASNTIHMLDLFAFITGRSNLTIDPSKLDKKIYESKRTEFIEFGGRLIAQTEAGDSLELLDDRAANLPLLMSIETGGEKFEIHQSENLCKVFPRINNGESKEMPFHFPMQSELTSIQIEQILKSGTSSLTSIEESFILHKSMLKAFNEHLSNIESSQITICPIT